jgi:hypothetical protein
MGVKISDVLETIFLTKKERPTEAPLFVLEKCFQNERL